MAFFSFITEGSGFHCLRSFSLSTQLALRAAQTTLAAEETHSANAKVFVHTDALHSCKACCTQTHSIHAQPTAHRRTPFRHSLLQTDALHSCTAYCKQTHSIHAQPAALRRTPFMHSLLHTDALHSCAACCTQTHSIHAQPAAHRPTPFMRSLLHSDALHSCTACCKQTHSIHAQPAAHRRTPFMRSLLHTDTLHSCAACCTQTHSIHAQPAALRRTPFMHSLLHTDPLHPPLTCPPALLLDTHTQPCSCYLRSLSISCFRRSTVPSTLWESSRGALPLPYLCTHSVHAQCSRTVFTHNVHAQGSRTVWKKRELDTEDKLQAALFAPAHTHTARARTSLAFHLCNAFSLWRSDRGGLPLPNLHAQCVSVQNVRMCVVGVCDTLTGENRPVLVVGDTLSRTIGKDPSCAALFGRVIYCVLHECLRSIHVLLFRKMVCKMKLHLPHCPLVL